VARKIPFEDPVVLSYVRIAYVTTQLVILASYYWVSLTVCPHPLLPECPLSPVHR
jgi:hypothetical protein